MCQGKVAEGKLEAVAALRLNIPPQALRLGYLCAIDDGVAEYLDVLGNDPEHLVTRAGVSQPAAPAVSGTRNAPQTCSRRLQQ